LQEWQKRPTAALLYYVFDLLWHDGRNWTGKNVLQRRNQLQKIIRPDTPVQVGGFIAGHGIELFRLAKENGLEGIIVKRAASTYQPGKRSPDWLKIKARLQQESVIGGFTGGKEAASGSEHCSRLPMRMVSSGIFLAAGTNKHLAWCAFVSVLWTFPNAHL
jgi:bifunctional non-homologous end joining protein LigD